MNELLAGGKLPSIQKHLACPGSSLTGVTAFPSTTGPAYMPYLTGCLSATCNVPGIRWLDKVKYAKKALSLERYRSYVGFETFLIGRDMRRELSTLFDLLPNSYNIFNSVCKGVSFFKNQTSLVRVWYWYYAHLTDHWNFVDTVAIRKLKKALSKPFDMIFAMMPGIDEYSHVVHYKDAQTIKAYEEVDRAVELMYTELSAQGKWEDTLIWLVSDHGLSVTHTHFCINKFLEKRGIKTFYYPKIYRKGCVAANMVSGNGMSNIYFKHEQGWQYPVYRSDIEKLSPNLLKSLIAEDAVDILACREGPHSIAVYTKKGSALIALQGDIIKYTVKGTDPFGYENMKGRVNANQIIELTIDSEYPDALYQLAHLFTSNRCGDVVVSAAKGFDLRDEYEVPEHKGSHGSLHKEHMLVPLITNSKLKAKYARTIDVFPTILKSLGHPVPVNIDGTPLC